MAVRRTAILINRVTGEKIPVTATANHPGSSYRRPVWVDDTGTAIIEVSNLPNPTYDVTLDSAADRIRIGQELAELRTNRGLTLREVEETTGVDRSNLAKIEKGTYSLTLDILSAICRVYGKKIALV